MSSDDETHSAYKDPEELSAQGEHGHPHQDSQSKHMQPTLPTAQQPGHPLNTQLTGRRWPHMSSREEPRVFRAAMLQE